MSRKDCHHQARDGDGRTKTAAVGIGAMVGRHFEQGLTGLIIGWREESK